MDFIHFVFLFHVPLFFFISGYLEKVDKCNPVIYLKKTCESLIVPYFVWNLLFVFLLPSFSIKGVIALCTGLSLWNGASWFLMVLFFVKLLALTLKNRRFLIGIFLLIIFALFFFYNKRMPFYANLTFMFIPFFLAGMYGKLVINKIVEWFETKYVLNLIISFISIFLLWICYKYCDIPHTHSVVDFTDSYIYIGLLDSLELFSCFFSHCVSIEYEIR